MSLTIRPTEAAVGAYVSGPDIGNLCKGDAAELYTAFINYGVLIFKGLKLGVAEQVALSKLFGEMDEPHPLEELRQADVPNISVLAANGGQAVAADDPDAEKIIGTIPWHADRIYTATPNRGALLRAVVIPEQGGYTGTTAGLNPNGYLLVDADDHTQRTVLSGGVREATTPPAIH